MMEAWASFAKTGSPSTPTLGKWPALSFPAEGDQHPRLPQVPASMEHMNFEHERVGLVSYGWEEMRIWYTHARRLEKLLIAQQESSTRLRATTAAMATALFGMPPQ